MKVLEYKTVSDGTTGKWGAKGIIDVTKVELSSVDMRSTTDITIEFTLPTTSDTSMNDADFVGLELPFFWMTVPGWVDGSVAAAAALSLGTTAGTPAKTTYAAVKGAVSMVSGCNLVFELDTAATKLKEGSKYRFVVSGVPTAWHATWGPMMNLGSLSVSVGKVASGGSGWSSAQFFNPLKAQGAKKGLHLLAFKSSMVTISRGTYTKDAVCIMPPAT